MNEMAGKPAAAFWAVIIFGMLAIPSILVSFRQVAGWFHKPDIVLSIPGVWSNKDGPEEVSLPEGKARELVLVATNVGPGPLENPRILFRVHPKWNHVSVIGSSSAQPDPDNWLRTITPDGNLEPFANVRQNYGFPIPLGFSTEVKELRLSFTVVGRISVPSGPYVLRVKLIR
ncbi:MAG: hypothetical protein ACJ79H_02440 [Myxococcales bacterium]